MNALFFIIHRIFVLILVFKKEKYSTKHQFSSLFQNRIIEMNHSITLCWCSIFDDKNMSLKILTIHSILVDVENCFLQNENFNVACEFYQHPFLKNFLFYVKVELMHAGQLKGEVFIMKCILPDLLYILKCNFDPSKIIMVKIEMLNEISFRIFEKRFYEYKMCVSYDVYLSSRDNSL